MTDQSIHYECDLFEWAERQPQKEMTYLDWVFDPAYKDVPNPPRSELPESNLLAIWTELAERMEDEYGPIQERWQREDNQISQSRRRWRKHQSEVHFTRDDVTEIYQQQDGRCGYCGIPFHDGDYEIEHMIPLSRGGSNAPENIMLSCKECNSAKGTHTPEEWQMYRGYW